MSQLRFYGYAKCSTCRAAKQALRAAGHELDERDITVEPPPRVALEAIVASGVYHISHLLNRSGEVYRSMNMKEQIKRLSTAQLLDLLARHGRLLKRPIVTDGTRVTVGYDPDVYRQTWNA